MSRLTCAVRAEFTKLAGGGLWLSPVLYACLPLASLLPLALNAAIAAAAQADLLIGAGGMETGNVSCWTLTFTVLIMMFAAVASTCREYADRTIGAQLSIQPRRWTMPVAKVITYGLLAVVASLVTTLTLLLVFPVVFPDVWGTVEPWTTRGVRQIYGVPLVALLLVALGTGVSLLVRRSGAVIMLVLLWKFGVEFFFTFIPGETGVLLQRLSPFKNAETGAGQQSSIETLFGGPAGSLVYFAVVCLVILLVGVVRLSRRGV